MKHSILIITKKIGIYGSLLSGFLIIGWLLRPFGAMTIGENINYLAFSYLIVLITSGALSISTGLNAYRVVHNHKKHSFSQCAGALIGMLLISIIFGFIASAPWILM